MKIELKTGQWEYKEIEDVPKNGLNVFSCFHCAGGSTMGYKLAGFNVLGGVEIDPEIMKIYKENHNPKYSFLMGVQDFKNIPNEKLPHELFDLDVLDGSPPCSSFSMAGSREDAWGDEKKFREGQAHQVLDDLFFHYIQIADKLRPKVVVAENVKGLIAGNAKGYVKEIFKAFSDIGYDCQLFLLNASFMGVPQRRERTFFIANRIGKQINLSFNEPTVSVKEAFSKIDYEKEEIPKNRKDHDAYKYWKISTPGESFAKYHPKKHLFTSFKIAYNNPASTLLGNAHTIWHFKEPRGLSSSEFFAIQSFPKGFKVKNHKEAGYICGMSVPPFMMQRIANQIAIQFFNKNS
jgi:DNA (cytosine-5)-methyltransferase 1